ncbi:MAG: DUF222 domain-containing protein [Jiangellaceae bacterium]
MFEAVVHLADRLSGLVDTLDPDRVTGPHARELWAAFDRVERLGAAGKTLLARRLGDVHQADRAGVKTAAEELARLGGTTTGVARDALETSKRLADLPGVQAAVRRGDLSTSQAVLVSSAAAADHSAEQRLLDVASTASMSELREECARVRAIADPDPEATNRRLHAGRRLRRFTDADGAWTLIGKGTPQAGAGFNTVLDPIIDEIFRAARAAGRQEPHEAYAFDALMILADRACGRRDGISSADRRGPADTGSVPVGGPPDTRSPRPRPNERYLALLRVDVEALRRGGVTGDQVCEISGVGPVPVTVARELLGDAVLKLVITRGIDVCNVTHLGRGPTAAQRIALAWTSPGCTVEGCARTRVEYDHRLDWKDTRHTRLDELDPLCAYHHGLRTRLRWALVPGHGKRPLVPPDDPRHPRHQRSEPRRTPTARGRAGPVSGRTRPRDPPRRN